MSQEETSGLEIGMASKITMLILGAVYVVALCKQMKNGASSLIRNTEGIFYLAIVAFKKDQIGFIRLGML
jgi:hypothetical protein